MLGILLTVGCFFGAPEPAANPPEPAPEVRRLIRQLDASQLGRRNEAEAALIALGPGILPLLPSSEAGLSAEVWQRLGRVRQNLEQAEAAAAVGPGLVTLKNQQTTLSGLIKEIERQTGNRVVDVREQFGQQASDPELTVDFDKTPFWQVLDEVMKQTGLNVYPFGAEQTVQLVERRDGAKQFGENSFVGGPFLFVPMEFLARRDLDKDAQGTLRLDLLIAWEPRMAPIGLTQKLDEIEAVDGQGNALTVDAQLGALEVPVKPKATSVKLTIPFALPSRDVKEIARLTATLDALVPGPIETFRFDGLPGAKQVKRRVASATVTLWGMQKNHDIWEVEVHVRFDEASDALASHRGWIFSNEAYLEAPGGKRLENEGFETKLQTENEVGLAYFFYFEDSPKNYKFVYKTPSRIFTTRLKYELKDLPLP